MKYLLNIPSISSLEMKYVKNVVTSGWLSIGGKHTLEFEKKFCRYLGLKNSLTVQSGTAALHVAMRALEIGPGDNVIIPNYTCVSNISCVSQVGAKAIIVEVERETLGLDFDLVKIAIQKYKPKALQLVHVYGFPARDTLKILKYCKKKKIKVIEDASEALGAKILKKKIGTFGDISIFSLRSEKMIGVGEGGIIFSNNKKIFNKIKLIASRHAPFRTKKDPYWKKYYVDGEGYNYLLPHLLGAIGRAQIERFEKDILKAKIKVGSYYKKAFSNIKEISISQSVPKGFHSSYWLNSIYFKNLNSKEVQKIGLHLVKNGIEVRSGFWPLAKMDFFKSVYVCGNDKVSDSMFEKSITLPSNINLKYKDVVFIKNKIENILK